MPSQPCTVCMSPHRELIDAHVEAGRPKLEAAKKYGVSRSALNRHVFRGHVRPSAAVAAARASLPPVAPNGDYDPVASLQKQLNDLHATDTSNWSPAALDRHRDLTRRVAESLAKAKPPADLEGPAQRELAVVQEMARVQALVLDRFPEARRAVAEAIREWKASRRASAAEE